MTRCAVCGTPAPEEFRPPRAVQAPDLDGRPGEPARSTLARWVATCHTCGASAPDLSALPAGTAKIIAGEDYLALRQPGPAMAHLRWARLAEAAGQRRHAAEALLAAAWATEDSDLPSGDLRRRAALLFAPPDDDAGLLRLIDILRRAGAFEEAASLAGSAKPQDETGAAILAFERARIGARDPGRHQISAALPPPAHRPHVSHGKTPAPGFLKNLFARRS